MMIRRQDITDAVTSAPWYGGHMHVIGEDGYTVFVAGTHKAMTTLQELRQAATYYRFWKMVGNC